MRTAVGVVTGSFFTAENTSFIDCAANCLTFEKAASVLIKNCTFENCHGHALSAIETTTVIIEQCHVRNCDGAASFVTCPDVHIIGSTFQQLGQTVVFADNSTIEVRDSVICRSEGNGINIAHHGKVTASYLAISETKYPAMAVCDDSRATVHHCRMTQSFMNGVVIRASSTARFSDCWIDDAGQHTICVSDSRPVVFSRCYVGRGRHTCFSIYNTSHVVISDCLVVGRSPVGIDVFTGGRCDAKRCIVHGITERYIHVHHGGSVRFARIVLREAPPGEVVVEPEEIISSINFVNDPIVGAEKAIATESDKEVIVLGSSIGGSASFDFVRHLGVSPRPPADVRHPPCEVCGGDAGSCLFSPCGHAWFCRNCWDQLPQKPAVCPLCKGEISRVLAPVDCSWEGSDAECPICAENAVHGFVVPCGHTLCSVCAAAWLDKHPVCPYCRAQSAKFRAFIWHS
jgi:hypothetical protein